MRYARLIANLKELPLGLWAFEFEWEGECHLPVRVERRYLRELSGAADGSAASDFPRRLSLHGIPLLFTGEEDYVRDAGVYVRADGVNILFWIYYSPLSKFVRRSRPVYGRIILTLMIWGLADVPRGTAPGWRCIKLPFRSTRPVSASFPKHPSARTANASPATPLGK